jgi:hypothetical protein
MNLTDVFNAQTVAINHTEAASNAIPYFGLGLFPEKKKAGLDLKWIRTAKGLPVSLMPAAFDTKATIRSRSGFKMEKTQMAFFREQMVIKEEDEQEMLRVQEASDPYAQTVLQSIYDDTNTLVDGAEVVPERMRMSLLSATDGHPKISIAADGAAYNYNYDPNGTYSSNNFIALSGTSKWSDTVNSDPLQDTSNAQDAAVTYSGTKPTLMIVSKQTMIYLKQNAKIKNYILAQNPTATVMITEQKVKEIFLSELSITIAVYTKQYKDESGAAQKFFPDGMATLVPYDGKPLGNTWFGTTPEERTLLAKGDASAQVSMVGTGIAVAVTTTNVAPIQTTTTVSEITLPSFERMDETYQIKCY